jgi:hypothetical protein
LFGGEFCEFLDGKMPDATGALVDDFKPGAPTPDGPASVPEDAYTQTRMESP